LEEKAVKLADKPLKINKKILASTSSTNIIHKMENLINGKKPTEQHKHSEGKPNCAGYLVHHLLLPLLALIERIQANYHQVYRPKGEMNDELCWASLNFLHKYGDFHRSFEEIGRYYSEEFVDTIFETLNVIDFDIRILYKKVVGYIRKSIEDLEKSIMESKNDRLSEE
jgi:hypothetical protein